MSHDLHYNLPSSKSFILIFGLVTNISVKVENALCDMDQVPVSQNMVQFDG